jgi:UDP-N-acetylglucosamine 3-dehydrogenase
MKIGVIGVGNMGQNHVRIYHELGAEIVGVADLDKQKAVKIANQYGAIAFTDYKKLLNYKLDAVSITAPTTSHREIALVVIEKGINLLVEKPIADSIAHGEEIVLAAEKAGIKLMIGYIERFNPVVRKLKDIIDEGILGTLILMSARRVGAFPPSAIDAGIMTDSASHDIDIIRYITNKEPVEVYSKLSHIQNTKGDCGLVVLDMGGVVASIEVNWFTPHKVRTMVVTGTKGIAYVDYIEQTLKVYNAGWKMEPQFERDEPLRLELKHFIECIEQDKQPLVSGKDGLKTLKIALEAENKIHKEDN